MVVTAGFEDKTTAILDAAVDGIVTIDQRGAILTVNPATERTFGYKVKDLVGRKVNMLMPEPHRSQHDRYLDNYLRTGQARIIGIGREVHGQRQDGSIFPMDISVGKATVGAARIFTGIVRDITKRKQTRRNCAPPRKGPNALGWRKPCSWRP